VRRTTFLAGAGAAAASTLGLPARAQYVNGNQPFLQQISIGVNVTLSGPLQKYGTEVARGVQAAVDETNHFTTALTRAWGMRAFDDRNDAALAATNANVAAADPTVIGIVGNLTGAMTLAALSRYANVNFAVVVPTVTADAVTNRGYHNVFRLPAKDSTSGRLFAQSVLPEKKGNIAIAVALDGDYGYDVARGFVQQAKSDRHDADALLFPVKGFDAAAAARTVMDRKPGYVFLCGTTAGLGPLAEALRLGGYRGDFGAGDGFYNGDTIAQYAKTLDGAYVASSLPPLDRIPSAVGLLTDFEREVGPVTAFSAYGYAAAQLLIAASQRFGAYTRFTLLASMQRSPTFTTLVGQYSFNVFGDPLIPNIYIYTVGPDKFAFSRPAIRNGFVL
jgi:ABC-type branched-subunit amino acid transport system substrate-binding protein